MQIDLIHFDKWLSMLKKKVFDKFWGFHHSDIPLPTPEDFVKKYFKILPSTRGSVEIYSSNDCKVFFLQETISKRKMNKIAISIVCKFRLFSSSIVPSLIEKSNYDDIELIKLIISTVYQNFLDNHGMILNESSTFFLRFANFFFKDKYCFSKFVAVNQLSRLRMVDEIVNLTPIIDYYKKVVATL